jgi:hypothetical protein
MEEIVSIVSTVDTFVLNVNTMQAVSILTALKYFPLPFVFYYCCIPQGPNFSIFFFSVQVAILANSICVSRCE